MKEAAFRDFLINQIKIYPLMGIRDVFKGLYQSIFGCEHLIEDEEKALFRLNEELNNKNIPERASYIEELGSHYCRLHLCAVTSGKISENAVFRLFIQSASPPRENASEQLAVSLELFTSLCEEGIYPFNTNEVKKEILRWGQEGFGPLHHSDEFTKIYHPAYRVIKKAYCAYIPLLETIQELTKKKERLTIAIEGGSATGKSTFAALLADMYEANLFHTDDYFLQPYQRTPARLGETGGNMDRERFEREVLSGISSGKSFSYQPFDCTKMELGQMVRVSPKKINIVEGAYSMHPAMDSSYDIRVFLKTSSETAINRIKQRNSPAMQKRFFNEWMVMEQKYFEAFSIEEHCDFVIINE